MRRRSEMAEPIQCPHCGNTERFIETFGNVDVIDVYDWNQEEERYRLVGTQYEKHRVSTLECGKCDFLLSDAMQERFVGVSAAC